jgi:hypothetical protein
MTPLRMPVRSPSLRMQVMHLRTLDTPSRSGTFFLGAIRLNQSLRLVCYVPCPEKCRMKRLFFALPALLVVAACSSELSTSVDGLSPRLVVSAAPTTVFDNIPALLPPNIVSLGYQCCQVSELGDLIQLGGTARHASSVTVIMSDWASRWVRPPDHANDLRFEHRQPQRAGFGVGNGHADLYDSVAAGARRGLHWRRVESRR